MFQLAVIVGILLQLVVSQNGDETRLDKVGCSLASSAAAHLLLHLRWHFPQVAVCDNNIYNCLVSCVVIYACLHWQ